MPSNHLIHAVAGGGKTTKVINHCAEIASGARVLVLTYTNANQDTVRQRLADHDLDMAHVTVMGWFQFLISCWARPYVPFRFPGRRVRGFNFDGDPGWYAKDDARFFDKSSAVYKRNLSSLSHEIHERSSGAPVKWLERSYDLIVIDEVQDLNGWDLEILDLLLASNIPLLMVGDTRQAILATNVQDRKHKQYLYSAVIKWFRLKEKQNLLTIEEDQSTWRCHPSIAAFADTIFGAESDYAATISKNTRTTGHDGVFLIRPEHIAAYNNEFKPAALRFSASSGKKHNLSYSNFGEVKGLEYDRVLLAPTGDFEKFIKGGVEVTGTTASKFYVGVTRARQSVALIVDKPGSSTLPCWTPVS